MNLPRLFKRKIDENIEIQEPYGSSIYQGMNQWLGLVYEYNMNGRENKRFINYQYIDIIHGKLEIPTAYRPFNDSEIDFFIRKTGRKASEISEEARKNIAKSFGNKVPIKQRPLKLNEILLDNGTDEPAYNLTFRSYNVSYGKESRPVIVETIITNKSQYEKFMKLIRKNPANAQKIFEKVHTDETLRSLEIPIHRQAFDRKSLKLLDIVKINAKKLGEYINENDYEIM
ncbi:MAG: hypothetical protein J7K26_02510 [Candidatus Aenigmarchaeota archaeon]|nr:hypothetical protein [Candidatus Aenigmarchaeota archaeon]